MISLVALINGRQLAVEIGYIWVRTHSRVHPCALATRIFTAVVEPEGADLAEEVAVIGRAVHLGDHQRQYESTLIRAQSDWWARQK